MTSCSVFCFTNHTQCHRYTCEWQQDNLKKFCNTDIQIRKYLLCVETRKYKQGREEWEFGFDTKWWGWFESSHIISDLHVCASALSFRLFLVSPIYWIWQMLQVCIHVYITFSESQFISEVIEKVSSVAWLVTFWHSTMIFHVFFTLTFSTFKGASFARA